MILQKKWEIAIQITITFQELIFFTSNIRIDYKYMFLKNCLKIHLCTYTYGLGFIFWMFVVTENGLSDEIIYFVIYTILCSYCYLLCNLSSYVNISRYVKMNKNILVIELCYSEWIIFLLKKSNLNMVVKVSQCMTRIIKYMYLKLCTNNMTMEF